MARILLIDDHDDIREVLKQILVIHAHTVECLSASAKALELIQTMQPDVIIVDQHLPVTSGIELIQQIRSNPSLSNTYLILCSGDDSIRENAISAGAQEFWTKGSDEIFDRIARLDEVLSRDDSTAR